MKKKSILASLFNKKPIDNITNLRASTEIFIKHDIPYIWIPLIYKDTTMEYNPFHLYMFELYRRSQILISADCFIFNYTISSEDPEIYKMDAEFFELLKSTFDIDPYITCAMLSYSTINTVFSNIDDRTTFNKKLNSFLIQLGAYIESTIQYSELVNNNAIIEIEQEINDNWIDFYNSDENVSAIDIVNYIIKYRHIDTNQLLKYLFSINDCVTISNDNYNNFNKFWLDL